MELKAVKELNSAELKTNKLELLNATITKLCLIELCIQSDDLFVVVNN